MDRDLVRDGGQLPRETLDPFNEEGDVRQARPFRAPRSVREGVGTGVDGDGERRRLGPRAVQNIAAVTRAHVHKDAAECHGYRSGLTDVHVHESFA